MRGHWGGNLGQRTRPALWLGLRLPTTVQEGPQRAIDGMDPARVVGLVQVDEEQPDRGGADVGNAGDAQALE
jgi:hypothetical protein